jgi:hypothetical protein
MVLCHVGGILSKIGVKSNFFDGDTKLIRRPTDPFFEKLRLFFKRNV